MLILESKKDEVGMYRDLAATAGGMCHNTVHCFLTLDEGHPWKRHLQAGGCAIFVFPSDRLPESQWQCSRSCNAGPEQLSFVMGAGLGDVGHSLTPSAHGISRVTQMFTSQALLTGLRIQALNLLGFLSGIRFS